METIKDRLLGLISRKFVIAVMIVIMAFVALMMGKLDSTAFVTVASIIAGIFSASNVLQGKLEPKEPEA